MRRAVWLVIAIVASVLPAGARVHTPAPPYDAIDPTAYHP